MLVYAAGGLAARVATVLCVVVIALPYLLRRGTLSGASSARAVPFLQRMWPHYWAGYAVLVLSFFHAGSVMRVMGRADGRGIWAATAAFLLLMFEMVVGLSLREGAMNARRSLRRIHFWVMVLVVGFLGAHLWLNA